MNIFVGMLLVGLLFSLPMYLSNAWYTGYLPFNTNKLYDRLGNRYQIHNAVDDRANFDLEKYKSYSVRSFLMRLTLVSQYMGLHHTPLNLHSFLQRTLRP